MAHPFTEQPLFSSAQLPATLMSLDDWALVTLTGPDTVKYLQGQLTADVNALQAAEQVLCAHCDAKGKMWSTLHLFHYGDGLAYLERRSVRDSQLAELKKYAVFSKTTLTADDSVVLLGAAGDNIRSHLAPLFDTLPDADNAVVHHPGATLVHLSQPAERFVLVLDAQRTAVVIDALQAQITLNDSRQWLALEIEAGRPVIDSANSAQFIPQATNLQALQGISFTKGCYAGQEMVARAKYRGANKRALYWLAGSGAQTPAVGDELELKLGDNWRRTGTVLASSQLHDGTLWVQAVLNNDLDADSVLRVRDDSSSQLAVQPLPYSLAE
ncbi:tRNA-modifying protein YgfZ [Dickeya zeae]|uniref:tRNA-modifying protein YgfZ n=1 Tax=Dickeya zeae TaxID=204042 RepID=UPI00036455EA|nr:tRNA-modifying protein YgfZ [Dickeya zeae]UJR53148.1 tRNA-modifying protein YgfZ [Dickeya zeae MS1]